MKKEPRYVIYHQEHGVYLGGGQWSNTDNAPCEKAPTFNKIGAADMLSILRREMSVVDKVEVNTTEWSATIGQCVEAGLPAWGPYERQVVPVYLAARYSRREELCDYKAQLEGTKRYVVTSRWLAGKHQIDDGGLSAQADERERVRFAQEDWADLERATILVAFTEVPRSTQTRGGRHVELGAALAWGKTVYVVGPRENVFCCLPQVKVYETFYALFADVFAWSEMGEAARTPLPVRY